MKEDLGSAKKIEVAEVGNTAELLPYVNGVYSMIFNRYAVENKSIYFNKFIRID